jgi:transcription initiation factor TFIIB
MGKRASFSGKDECPECGNQDLISNYQGGETICDNCGLVITEQGQDRGPEWRAFNQAERNQRSRASRSRIGLPTFIGPHDKDSLGRKIPLSKRLELNRLKKWQARSRIFTSFDRNLGQAEAELDRLLDKLHLPSRVKGLAMSFYVEFLKKGLVRGRSIDGVVAAAIYAACRKLEIPRSLDDISEHSLLERKDIARDYRFLRRTLGLRQPVHRGSIFLGRVAGNLRLSEATQYMASQILDEAERRRISAGKDPRGLAAAALYIACRKTGEKRTQKEIAEEAGVTEVTIRNRYGELVKKLKINLEKEEQELFGTSLEAEQIIQNFSVLTNT